LIVGDDIEIPSNSSTPDLRNKLAELVKEFAAVITPNGKIVYLGTPQTELSLYNVLESRGYQLRIWTSEYPNAEEIKGYGSRLAPFILDRLDSNKFPLKISDLIIAACLPDKAPQEILWSNNPLLKLKDLPNVAMAGQTYFSSEVIRASYSPYDQSVMVIDPSGRGKDETGYAVAKMCCGNIFIPAAGGLQGGYSDETLIALCNIAKLHKVNKIVIESNFGDNMYAALLTPHLNRIYPCSMEEVRQNAQKELRIVNSLEPVMNQHRLIVDPSVIQQDYDSAMSRYAPDVAPQYMLFYQMSRLSKDRGALKHDDRLDALAMAVQYFTESLNVDAKANEERRKQELWDAELEKWRQEVSGGISDHRPLTFHERVTANILNPRSKR
jgi:hypothetical protein